MYFMNSLMPIRQTPFAPTRRPIGLPIWYAPDDGDAGQPPPAGDDKNKGKDNPTAPGGRLDPDRWTAKHGGDPVAALRAMAYKLDDVEADNASYRQQLGELRGKVPAEGTVVLDKDQATAWAAYQELGKPEEIKDVHTKYAASQRNELYRAAAEAHNYKADVLGQLPGAADLQIEIKEIQADGKAVKTAVVKNGDGKETALPDYVKAHWEAFTPSLVAQQQQTTPSGTPWPKQGFSGSSGNTDPVAARLEANKQAQAERKNPLQK